MSTTLSDTRTTARLAVIEIDETSDTTLTIREPDYYDEGMSVWIGPDAAVQADMDLDLSDLMERVGWLARKGDEPSTRGVVVTPHGDYTHPAAQASNADIYSRWQLVRDTLTAA